MGCLCTKNSVAVAPQTPQRAPTPHQEPPPQSQRLSQETGTQEAAVDAPSRRERIPRGNIAVYSKYLKKFQRLLKHGNSGKDAVSPVFADA